VLRSALQAAGDERERAQQQLTATQQQLTATQRQLAEEQRARQQEQTARQAAETAQRAAVTGQRAAVTAQRAAEAQVAELTRQLAAGGGERRTFGSSQFKAVYDATPAPRYQDEVRRRSSSPFRLLLAPAAARAHSLLIR
jgi:hypothetical protein